VTQDAEQRAEAVRWLAFARRCRSPQALSCSNLENWKAAVSLQETFGERRRMAAPGRRRVYASARYSVGNRERQISGKGIESGKTRSRP